MRARVAATWHPKSCDAEDCSPARSPARTTTLRSSSATSARIDTSLPPCVSTTPRCVCSSGASRPSVVSRSSTSQLTLVMVRSSALPGSKSVDAMVMRSPTTQSTLPSTRISSSPGRAVCPTPRRVHVYRCSRPASRSVPTTSSSLAPQFSEPTRRPSVPLSPYSVIAASFSNGSPGSPALSHPHTAIWCARRSSSASGSSGAKKTLP
mmetsp:Transcript_11576/g.40509  ORF Transcript_11576/g.40509 Transcript_11576/m.40509 type:complete len:208 (+) Transcript_11576:3702-4325(+)